MNKIQKFPALQTIFKACSIDARKIAWHNLSTLGDNNISHIIQKILSMSQWYIGNIKKWAEDDLLTKKEKMLFKNQLVPFLAIFNKRQAHLIKEIQSHLTGENKPLLPCFRQPGTYYRKHVVFLPYKNQFVEQEWKSAVTPSSSNNGGSQRYHLETFRCLIKDGQKQKAEGHFSHCGHYWQVQITSSTVMSFEELQFFKNTKDEEFINLWFSNSGDRDVRSISTFKSLLKQNTEVAGDFDFKGSVKELMKFFKKGKNFPEDNRREMESSGKNLQKDFTRYFLNKR